VNGTRPPSGSPAHAARRVPPRRTALQLALPPIATEIRSLSATGTERELHVCWDLVDRIFAAEVARKAA